MSMSRNTKATFSPILSPAGSDRRTVCRYSVVQADAWLGWWEGQAFQSTAAKIVDISLRGARLHVDAFPPNDLPAWFCPPGVSTKDEWIETKLVGMRKKLFGPREVRLAFRKVFPYEVFKAVVYGPDACKAVETAVWVSESVEERDWW